MNKTAGRMQSLFLKKAVRLSTKIWTNDSVETFVCCEHRTRNTQHFANLSPISWQTDADLSPFSISACYNFIKKNIKYKCTILAFNKSNNKNFMWNETM